MDGKVTLYLDGIPVELPVPATGANPADIAAAAAAQVRAYLSAGFSADDASADMMAEIGLVVRRQHVKDGKRTPVIDMYRSDEYTQKRWLGVYLNTPHDIAAFESAAGIKIDKMPLFDGDAPLQLDVEAQQDRIKRYGVRVTPFAIEWRNNPKYNPGDKKTSKRQLVRYMNTAADSMPAGVAPSPSDKAPAPFTGVKRVTAVKMQTDDMNNWVIVLTVEGASVIVPAAQVKGWTLPDKRKNELKKMHTITAAELDAVYNGGRIVDVREREIAF